MGTEGGKVTRVTGVSVGFCGSFRKVEIGFWDDGIEGGFAA